MASNSYRDLLAWGSTLDHESLDISSRAKQLFQRAKTKLSLERGHGIAGINGNDRALACLCLCLIKLPNATAAANRKAIETSLQRTSGVTARIFSGGLRELPRILGTGAGVGSANASPTRKGSPSKRKGVLEGSSRGRDDGSKIMVGGSGRKTEGKNKPAGRATRDALMVASTPLKRPASSLSADEEGDGVRSSPTTKRRMRRIEEAPVPEVIQPIAPGSAARTPRQGDLILEPTSVRTIRKTPLALPIHRPPKPMTIFHSHPVFNPSKPGPTHLDFSDWNWKSNLFNSHWSIDDVREWERWNQKALDTSLS